MGNTVARRKPFIKYAGRKDQLVDQILSLLPPGDRLVEPFCGSGAVSLAADYPSYWLNDANADLINLYQHTANKPDFIDQCEAYFSPKYHSRQAYMNLRSIFRARTSTKDDLAAIMLYLGRFCFNGLQRFNAAGRYNTSYGNPDQIPGFPRAAMESFRDFARQAIFTALDFRTVMRQVRPGDVLYCDPPYVPLKPTSNFVGYASGGFGLNEARALNSLAVRLRTAGHTVVISNSDTPVTLDAFKGASKVIPVTVRRSIAGDATKRGRVGELLLVYSPDPNIGRLDQGGALTAGEQVEAQHQPL